jgi:GNAT superfamily N-acetyltransferase
MLKNKIAKLAAVLKERSLDGLLDVLAWNTPAWLFFYSHTYLVTTVNPGWTACPQPDVTLRLAEERDAGLFEKLGMRREVFLSRIRAGDRSAIAVADGKILTMIWGAVGRMFIAHCGIEFDSGEDGCYYYGSYTAEEARGRGLFSSVRQFLFRIYAREGRIRNWGAVSVNNSEWLRSVLAKNYVKIGEAYFIRFLFLSISYRKSWPFPIKKWSAFVNGYPRVIKHV